MFPSLLLLEWPVNDNDWAKAIRPHCGVNNIGWWYAFTYGVAAGK